MTNMLKGIAFCLLLFFSSVLGSIFLMGSTLPFLLISPRVFRAINDRLMWLWMLFCVALTEIFMGSQVKVFGESFSPNDRSLVIMNHRTRLDWLYLWNALFRFNSLHRFKIILKDDLKCIPGFGWAMQVAIFIFLQRRWDVDRPFLEKFIQYFFQQNYRTSILIFPEGTDFNEKSRKRSDDYVAKMNAKILEDNATSNTVSRIPKLLRRYEYCLIPRTTGFNFMLQQMRDFKCIDAVYDITVGYGENIVHAESDLIWGKYPKAIHFHLQRHDASTLPTNENSLSEWLEEKWSNKEDFLKEYYEHRTFMRELNPATNFSLRQRLSLYAATAFWLIMIAIWLISLVYSCYARYFFLLMCVVYVVVGKFFGGMDSLIINRSLRHEHY